MFLLEIFNSWIGMMVAVVVMVMAAALLLFAALSAIVAFGLLVGALALPANKPA
jgi:hypothetical protein